MSTELITIDAASISEKHFEVSREELKQTVEQFVGLTIQGVHDTAGLKSVRDARLALREKRCAIENRRKELKAGALDYGRKVDKVAKDLTAIVSPEEERLKALEDAIEAEKENIRKAALQKRVDALVAVDSPMPIAAIENMDDSTFADLLDVKTTIFNERRERERKEAEEQARREAEEAAERKRQEEEAERLRKAEEERLKAEREAIEAERKAMEEERRLKEEEDARIEAERQKVLAEERRQMEERERQLQAEREKVEAENRRLREEQEARERAERERIEAEERAQREKEAEERRAAEADAARKRAEALRPDREKLIDVANQINGIELPAVSEDAEECKQAIDEILAECEQTIRDCIDEHIPAATEGVPV